MIKTFILLTVLSVSSFAYAFEFEGVKDLQAIKADYDKLGTDPSLKFDKERNALQKEASGIIQKMAPSDGKLSSQQIAAFVELLSIAEPVDPAHAMIENNRKMIETNREVLEAEISKLSAAQKERILSSFETVLDQTPEE